MSYQERLNEHLTRYKHSRLGILEPGIFKYRGRDVPKDHILPRKDSWLNLLPEARGLARGYLAGHSGVKRHRFFHHLNSSQAFAFNLFFPFFGGDSREAALLLRALQSGQALRSWEPEAIPDAEEESNIDVLWVDADGITTFCEVKLSETEFGSAQNDTEHKKKLADLYRPVLEGGIADELLESERFFGSYQILRNIWHMARVDGSRLIFLLPRANAPLWVALDDVLPHVSPGLSSRISVVAIEDVFERLLGGEPCPTHLRSHVEECKAKYIV